MTESSAAPRSRRRSGVVIRVARHAVVLALFLLSAALGTASGVFFVYAADLPQISALDDYTPSTITRVYTADGRVVGEFAVQRRVVVGYDQIAPVLRQALIAAEDQDFNTHVGVSISRIIVTLIRDIWKGEKAGASTLTQQLARNLFLTNEKTWERKIKEAILTVQIEKRYTKQEILTLYCNHIPWGHGRYGAEAASRLYFDKSARDLTLDEASMLAGIVQAPARQSPFVSMDAALRRRNYALQRMAEEGFISQKDAEAARKRPIVTRGTPSPPDSPAPFYVEEVRKYLEQKFGAKQLYENGLSVRTPLDLRLQLAANKAVDKGLRDLDKRRGFRRPARAIDPASIDAFRDPRWGRAIHVDDVVPAVVRTVDANAVGLRVAGYTGTIAREGFKWTGRTKATDLLKPGQVVDVRVTAIDDGAQTLQATLEQEPVVEGALLAIENRSGRILAMVGGLSFDRSKFNRAIQAARQLGSTFKPLVYTTAIDRGFTPASIIVDAPVSYSAGPGQPPYSPSNYDNTFEGAITLRRALEQSRNVPAVRMMETLGPAQVIAYARKFGFESPMQPYLSTALGAAEATLLEIVAAYSVFPNQGVRMKPTMVLRVMDRDGNVLEDNRPEPTDAIRADTAYVMTSLLQGVVQRGTAARAASLNWPLGGKTGTTNDYTDAWFIGFDPDITVGVWVGYDQKRPLGPRETGAQAALPIWMDFMKTWIGDRKDRPEFPAPGNILFVNVDRATGTVTDSSDNAIPEVFISGTQPTPR